MTPTPWSGTVTEPLTVTVLAARVVCGVCGQNFKMPVEPPVVVGVDPRKPPVGALVVGAGTRAVPQHTGEPGWRCTGSGTTVAVRAESGTSVPGWTEPTAEPWPA